MLNFPKDTKHEHKCYVTHGTMGHLDPKQPSVKRKPFVNILNQKFVRKVEMILPKEVYEIIEDELLADNRSPVYSRVILPLKALLEGDFFTEYIKKGNILMLSEGRIGVDNVFSLREGLLTLHLDKETYERCGLVGKPEGAKGKREHRSRWIVEINLRLPSMLHGKKGFDRIVYAFKNILTIPVTWLFCDLGTIVLSEDPLLPHHPHKVTCSPAILRGLEVNMPILKPTMETNNSYDGDFQDFAVEIHEWLSLISLESPRVSSTDKVDSFLCRYVPPGDSTTKGNLVKVTWTGFISSSWAHETLVKVLLRVSEDSWFSYYVRGFEERWSGEGSNCLVLKVPDAPNEYILWEVA